MREASDVIEHIYESSYKPEYWPIALEHIAEFTHSNSAALVYQDNELVRAGGSHVYNITQEYMEKYNRYGIDPNFKIMAENTPIGAAAAVDHIIDNRNELIGVYGAEFNDEIITDDLYHIGGAILFMDETRSAGIGLQRTKSMGAWKKDEIDKLNILIPHLQRAMNIQKEFIRLQTREQALRRGLDRLLMGLVLFDKELQPIYINPVAKSILNYHPAIEIKHDKIYAYGHENTEKIHTALVSAIAASPDADPTETSVSLGLKHPDCATTLPVIISPIQGILHGFETAGGHAHVVMCFSDPDRTHPIEADKLASVYELTPAEAQVAISIANGINSEEIANINEVEISTIRSQLKAIYRKLGIHSQAELVKVLLTGPFGQCV
jgi:DNA-binding CsgD family transcriptional regulator/PAS domain-containing protein